MWAHKNEQMNTNSQTFADGFILWTSMNAFKKLSTFVVKFLQDVSGLAISALYGNNVFRINFFHRVNRLARKFTYLLFGRRKWVSNGKKGHWKLLDFAWCITSKNVLTY
jgi:hypothetical protein